MNESKILLLILLNKKWLFASSYVFSRNKEVFVGRQETMLMKEKFFLSMSSIIILLRSMDLNCVIGSYGILSMVYMLQRDFLDAMRLFCGSQKVTIMCSILIQFVCLLNILVISILKARIK